MTPPSMSKAQTILDKVRGTDEPVFILRAKDILSIFAIQCYLENLDRFLPSDVTLSQGVVDTLDEFRRWQVEHPYDIRMPD